MSRIHWQRTGYGYWFPTVDGKDVFSELWRQSGGRCADAPVFEPGDRAGAEAWGVARGYSSTFAEVRP